MNQAQKTPEAWKQVEEKDELEIKPLDLGFDIHETMRLAGAQDVTEEEQAAAMASGGKRVRVLCCCRHPGCPIGPFSEIEEC